MNNLNQKRTPVGKIIGKVALSGFTIKFFDKITRRDYLTIFQDDTPYVFSIHRLWREKGELLAYVKIIGDVPDIPMDSNSEVFIATPDELINALKLEENQSTALNLGKIFGTNVNAKFNIENLGRLFITGRSGSGKSYTVGVLIEELIMKQVAIVILDRHGEYSTLKLFREDLDLEEFKRKQLENGNTFFDIEDVSSAFASRIIEFGDPTINPAVDLELEYIYATEPEDLVNSGQCTIINLSGLPRNKQRSIVDWLVKRLFDARIKKQIPGFFLFVDEAHELAGKKQTEVMETMQHVAQEGRKFDINLAVITQRPQALDVTLRAQAGTWIIHKLTDVNDINITLSSAEGLSKKQDEELIQNLTTGEAVIVGELSPLSPIIVKIRQRYTVHGGAGHNILDYVEEDKIHKSELIHHLKTKIPQKDLDSVKPLIDSDSQVIPSNPIEFQKQIEKNNRLEKAIQLMEEEIQTLKIQNKELKEKYQNEKKRADDAVKLAEKALNELKKYKKY
ncbi:MAG: helicase HerA domain-containing protein [Promethearchaeota archaeon]